MKNRACYPHRHLGNSRIDASTIAAGIGLALAIPLGASAQESPWYIGGSIGQSRVKLDTGGLSSDLAAAGMADTGFSANETDTGLKLFGGYRFHPNFSVEGGYVELGEFSASGTVTTFNFAPIVPLPASESARNSGFLLGAGVGYDFDRNVGIRLECEQFDKVGDKDKTGQGDVGLLSLGLVYRF